MQSNDGGRGVFTRNSHPTYNEGLGQVVDDDRRSQATVLHVRVHWRNWRLLSLRSLPGLDGHLQVVRMDGAGSCHGEKPVQGKLAEARAEAKNGYRGAVCL